MLLQIPTTIIASSLHTIFHSSSISQAFHTLHRFSDRILRVKLWIPCTHAADLVFGHVCPSQRSCSRVHHSSAHNGIRRSWCLCGLINHTGTWSITSSPMMNLPQSSFDRHIWTSKYDEEGGDRSAWLKSLCPCLLTTNLTQRCSALSTCLASRATILLVAAMRIHALGQRSNGHARMMFLWLCTDALLALVSRVFLQVII